MIVQQVMLYKEVPKRLIESCRTTLAIFMTKERYLAYPCYLMNTSRQTVIEHLFILGAGTGN